MLHTDDPIKMAKVRRDRIQKNLWAAEGGGRKRGYKSKRVVALEAALKKAENDLNRLLAPPRKTTTKSYTRKT
jgi:hypothetical protein